MDIIPLDDRVLVEAIEGQGKSAGGIIIPDVATDLVTMGRVVSVGAGRVLKDGKDLPLSVKVGDIVKFKQFAGNEVKIDGSLYFIMKESEIFGVVEGYEGAI